MIEGKNITVVGLGISGEAAVDFLHKNNGRVSVTDNSDTPQVREREARLKEKGIRCQIGGHTEDFIKGSELLVVSPGVDSKALPVEWAAKNNIPVISEVELAYKFCKAKIIAISGTNGKSTVTSIIGEIFKRAGKKAFVCGNIGTPFISVVPEAGEDDVIALEISSFQLERIEAFRPHIALMLNITEDHLDRYADFNGYKDAKLRLFANQEAADYAILNYDAKITKGLKGSFASDTLFFGKKRLPDGYNGAYVENEELVVRRDNKFVWFANTESLSLTGEHNIENGLASGLAAFLAGVDPEAIKDVLHDFKGLRHRFEHVDTIKGIKFIDDSKATNVDSTLQALRSLHGGVILIAGGRDKRGSYKVLKKTLKEKVKAILLIGEAKEIIKDALSDTVPLSFAESMEEAVKLSFEKAKSGNTVLLSPMCSSFDMFKDYKDRGEAFCKAVGGLKQDA